MKYKTGDYVKFLDDVGGGKIVKIIDDKTALVETEDGFEFPYALKNLVVIETETEQKQEQTSNKGTENFLAQSNEEIITKDNEDVNIYLALSPVNQAVACSNKKLVLINDSNWHIVYILHIKKQKHFESHPGSLNPNFIEEISVLTNDQLAEIKEIAIQVMFYRTIPYDLKEPVFKRFTFKPEKFFDASVFEKNDYMDEKAYFFTIIEENPMAEAIKKLTEKQIAEAKVQKQKNEVINAPKRYAKPPKEDTIEVDLHIHELLDDTRGMTPKDILDYQLDVFKAELNRAKKLHHIKKIVFIHGKGNGTLKAEIRRYLQINKLRFQDASFQKYGFGATLVFV